MSGIRFTRAQRRQLQKLADKIDRITQADRRFFERFPYRKFRVRIAGQAEIEQQKILDGKPVNTPPGYRVFVIVQNLAPGNRLRLLAVVREGLETDLPESAARDLWDQAASLTPQVREIEADMRRLVEDRA